MPCSFGVIGYGSILVDALQHFDPGDVQFVAAGRALLFANAAGED